MADSFPSILCVDDDPGVLERLTEYFTLRGFIVLTASNGVEACHQVKRWAPRAVILDTYIPRLGGAGTLARIQSIDPTLPVILTVESGEALAMVAHAGLSASATFAKPLDLDCIATTLTRLGVTPPAELAAPAIEPATAPAADGFVIDDEGYLGGSVTEAMRRHGALEQDAKAASPGSPEPSATPVRAARPLDLE